jgi:hypothetical protein
MAPAFDACQKHLTAHLAHAVVFGYAHALH